MKQKDIRQPTSFQIILMGELMVNLPVTIIILVTVLIIGHFGLLLGSLIGWYFWVKFLEKWKLWALSKNVDRERLFRLGKIGLINFYRYRIFDPESEENK